MTTRVNTIFLFQTSLQSFLMVTKSVVKKYATAPTPTGVPLTALQAKFYKMQGKEWAIMKGGATEKQHKRRQLVLSEVILKGSIP